MELRRLSGADVDQVLELWKDCSWSQKDIQVLLERNQSWGSWINGNLAAFVLAQPGGEGCEIIQLGTHQDARRRGVMRSLLKRFLDETGDDWDVWLEVNASNQSAINLYASLSFQLVGRRPNYYPDSEDALLYSWRKQA